MRRLFKPVMLLAFAALTLTLGSCKKDQQEESEETNDELKQAIVTQFVNNTVAPTYYSLAAETELLADQLKTLKGNMTQNNLDAACATFLEARAWWEKSEAFLFGAASDFGIDPHIDSWPLDQTAFDRLMSNPAMLEDLAGEDGDVAAGEQLGNAWLGFHGIEYIIFKDGAPKPVSEITENDMIYAVAVAGDLRNRCFQLEVSWIGDAAPQSHINKMEELELNTTVNGGDYSYGENMINAGKAGSTYPTLTSAMVAILGGCSDITDEVGTSKIGKPHTGEDPNYVESPYSQTSITDFANNLRSVYNAYMGGIDNARDENRSVHTFIQSFNSGLDRRLLNAINNAIDKIEAMKRPFVTYYSDNSAQEAMDACQALDEVLSEAMDALKEQ